MMEKYLRPIVGFSIKPTLLSPVLASGFLLYEDMSDPSISSLLVGTTQAPGKEMRRHKTESHVQSEPCDSCSFSSDLVCLPDTHRYFLKHVPDLTHHSFFLWVNFLKI